MVRVFKQSARTTYNAAAAPNLIHSHLCPLPLAICYITQVVLVRHVPSKQLLALKKQSKKV